MKFRSLGFRRFGAFDEMTLTFPADGRDLHVVYGRNEAGKSTALKGLTYFLFGFPKEGTHQFRYGLTEQRIVASFVDATGNELSAVRRRGNKNTLRQLDDKTPLSDDCLRGILGGLDEDQFAMFFGLDHAQLVAGGDTMTKGEGGLGQALFAAGAGLAGLRRIDERLRVRLESLFMPAGSKQAIAETLRQLKAEKQLLRERTLAVDAWIANKDQLTAAVERKKQLEDERSQLRQEDGKLTSYSAAFPTLQAVRGFEDLLRPLADVPQLPADFGARYQETTGALKIAQFNRDRHGDDVVKGQAALDSLPLETQVLAEEGNVLQIKEDLGAVLKADRDRFGLVELASRYRESARASASAIFGVDTGTSPPMSEVVQKQIHTLGQSRGALVAAVDGQRDRIDALDAAIVLLEQRLSDSREPIDRTHLERLERAVLQEGPLERRYADRVSEFQTELDHIHRDLAKLAPRWTGPIDAVPRLRVPTSERIAQFEAEFAKLDADARDLQKQREREAKTIRDRIHRLEALNSVGRVPDEAELLQARGDRDAGFDALVAGSLAAEFASRHAAANDLPQAVRNSIRSCDAAVDLMRSEAARVSEVAQCRADLRKAEEERQAIENSLVDLQAYRVGLEARWAAIWADESIDAGPPEVMRSWADQWSALKVRVEKLEKMSPEIEKLRASVEELKAALRAALSLDDREKSLSLMQLHERLRQTLDADRASFEARMKGEAQLQTQRGERESLTRTLAAAERQLDAWREEWRRAVAAVGLDADCEPDAANRRIDAIVKIQSDRHEADRLDGRLKSIALDRTEFVDRLRALCRQIDGADSSPLDQSHLQIAVDRLVSRVNEAKLREGVRAKAAKDCAASRLALAAAEREVIQCQSRLQSLSELAGFAKVEELPALIVASDRRRDLEERLAQARADLRHHARNQDIVEFVVAAESARDSLDVRLAEIRERLKAIDDEIPKHAVAADAASKQMDLWRSASSEAADRQQAIESLLAQLREHATEYAVVHLARQTLRLTIDRFRERREGTLLAGAERYFQILTRGRFAGLDVDENDKGEPILRALRRAPNERVDVIGLSDGTRDQLFLALRLAGIEQHIRSHGPMPVVVDDVLVNFDEDREAATLECLAELSKKTQVMVFTHHAHVVEMAKKVAGDAVCCHDLSAGVG